MQLFIRLAAVQFEFDEFSDAYGFHRGKPVMVRRISDRDSLRIEDASFWQHDDLRFHMRASLWREAERESGKSADERAGGAKLPGDNRGVGRLSSDMFFHIRTLGGTLALLYLCASAAGQPTPLTPEEIAGAARVDEISIPMPGEFMVALNKLGKLDWTAKFRPPVPTSYTSRAQMALNLGGLIADGYIAIEAEDSRQVKNIGRDVLSLAKSLGVSNAVLERSSSITGFAENNQWDQLKEELEATQNEVKAAMAEAKDQDLITLVTVGGWLRGTEVISGHVARNYTELGAKLLRQPGIAAFLNKHLDALGEKWREDNSVKLVRRKMQEIQTLTAFPLDKAPTPQDVQRLTALTTEVIKDISKKDSK